MNKKLVTRLAKAAAQNNKLRSIPNPTMAESFGENFNEEIAQQYLNPRGIIYETEQTTINQNKKIQKNVNIQNKDIPDEYGFKYKGAEPTRHGDWEHKGRCTDF